MYSRSPSRSNRSKGIKVKHILQVCLLVAVCFWLMYQVKHSHEKKKEFDENDAKLTTETESGNEIIRLGRKDISRVTETGREDKSNGEDDDENETDQGETRHEDDDQEREEIRTGDREEEEEDIGKGGEDDEIDRSGEEKTDEESHEEFVDEDKDRGEEESDEKIEDNENVEKENNEDSETVLENRDQEVVAENTHEAREENYKGDDASSEVAHDTRTIIPDSENATLKHTNGSSELIIDGKENVSQSSNQSFLEQNSNQPTEVTNSSDSMVSGGVEHKDNQMQSLDQAQVSNNLTQIESEQSTNITQVQNTMLGDGRTEAFNSTSGDTTDLASDKDKLDLKTVTNSTELANTTSVESLGSYNEVKLAVAENITVDNLGSKPENNVTNGEAESDTNDNVGSDIQEHVDTANDEAGAELQDNIDTAIDEASAELHDHDDDFASALTQEEKEYRTDTGTLPDIKVEVENPEDVEAE